MNRVLGSMEEALERTDGASPFNVVASLALSNAPCPEDMEAAIVRAAASHSILQMRLIKDGPRSFFSDESVQAIAFHAIERQGESHWKGIAEAALNDRLGGDMSPPAEIKYLHDQDGEANLILAFRHSIIDGASLVSFLDEILRECVEASRSYEPASLLPSMDEHLPAVHKSFFAAMSFVGKQLSDELGFRFSSRRRKQPAIPANSVASFFEICLEADLVQRLSRTARHHKVTMYATVSAALLIAANEKIFHGASGPVRLVSFHNLRPFLTPPIPDNQIGCFIAMGRSSIFLQDPPQFWDVAVQTNEKVAALGRSGEKFMMARMAVRMTEPMVRFKMMRMGTVALTINDASGLAAQYGEMSVRELHGMVSGQDIAPPFSVAATIFQGTWRLAFPYIRSEFDESEIEAYTTRVKALLEKVAL